MSKPKDRYPNLERRYPAGDEAGTRERVLRALGPSRVTVLLVGGTPAAKALVARALHDRSPRAAHPFVTVDCAAIAPSAVEEVLFGGPFHARSSPPRGAIRDAERGTLYIAAIDALPTTVQPRLLHFLDEPRAVRVVASTDAALAALARRGRFRADLAERISLVCVDLSEPDPV